MLMSEHRTEVQHARAKGHDESLLVQCVQPGDVLEDGREVVEVWSRGAYSYVANPPLTHVEFHDGTRFSARNGDPFPFPIAEWKVDEGANVRS